MRRPRWHRGTLATLRRQPCGKRQDIAHHATKGEHVAERAVPAAHGVELGHDDGLLPTRDRCDGEHRLDRHDEGGACLEGASRGNVRARVRARLCAHVRMCACACVCTCAHVHMCEYPRAACVRLCACAPEAARTGTRTRTPSGDLIRSHSPSRTMQRHQSRCMRKKQATERSPQGPQLSEGRCDRKPT